MRLRVRGPVTPCAGGGEGTAHATTADPPASHTQRDVPVRARPSACVMRVK